MIALIDADILCYEFGNMKDLETGELLAWPIVRKFVDERIEKILSDVEADEYEMYLTDSASNFRMDVATILPYKGHRDTEKPPHWGLIRSHLVDNYGATVCVGYEADDAVGMAQMKDFDGRGYAWYLDGMEPKEAFDTIICSRDKDLHMIPGWHYQWECGNQAMRKWFIDETDAIRVFYKQLLTGDATDNILGLFGVGSKAKCVKDIDELDSEQEMFNRVFKEYVSRFGAYAEAFLEENAQLLWIWRKDNDDITRRLEELFKAYEKECEESGNETSIQNESRKEQEEIC